MPQLEKISLEQYLRRPNPFIEHVEVKGHKDDNKTDTKDKDDNKTKGKNPTASSKNRNWDSPSEVKRWESFSLDAFDLIYGEPLQQILGLLREFNDFSAIPDFPFCEIRDEDSLETLLIRHVQSTVSEALAVAQSNLQVQDSSANIYMAKGGYALVSQSRGSKKPKNNSIYFYPDWAGVQRLDPPSRGKNLLPDKELVVVHIRSSDPDTQQPVARRSSRHDDLPLTPAIPPAIAEKEILEWKAIPWKHDSGSDQLTVNLALWWLHMMAARNGNLEEEDHASFSQRSNGQDTQGSGTTFNGFDSQEPCTPNLADLPGTDSQGNNMSFLSNTSEVRQGLSRTTISDGDGDGSPRPSKKRGRESEPKENGRKAKRGGRRHN